MGHWLLEVAKMAMYMSFPVGLFHYFNQPEYFEIFVIAKKREMYPCDDEVKQRQIDGAIRMLNEKEEQKALKALEVTQKLRATQTS